MKLGFQRTAAIIRVQQLGVINVLTIPLRRVSVNMGIVDDCLMAFLYDGGLRLLCL